jgi:hypothetical protein
MKSVLSLLASADILCAIHLSFMIRHSSNAYLHAEVIRPGVCTCVGAKIFAYLEPFVLVQHQTEHTSSII